MSGGRGRGRGRGMREWMWVADGLGDKERRSDGMEEGLGGGVL
jgi:hypothetical protein